MSPRPSKAQALNTASRKQRTLTRLESQSTEAALERDAAIRAAKDAGATYPEIAAQTGLSITRVTQVLRRTRTTTDSGEQNG